MGTQGGPNVPSPFLADVGKGRAFPWRRIAVLEHYDGTAWMEIGRYRSSHDASVALDAAMGSGAEPGTLRVTEAAPTTGSRVLVIVGVAVFAALLAFILFVLLG